MFFSVLSFFSFFLHFWKRNVCQQVCVSITRSFVSIYETFYVYLQELRDVIWIEIFLIFNSQIMIFPRFYSIFVILVSKFTSPFFFFVFKIADIIYILVLNVSELLIFFIFSLFLRHTQKIRYKRQKNVKQNFLRIGCY